MDARIVVTGGVHGDEPSGAEALPLLAERGFTTHGPCNPWGLEQGVRELENGGDLNRRFGLPDCEAAEQVRRFLAAHPPSLLLDLHEDCDSELPYLIQVGPRDPIGAQIVERLSDRWDFNPRPRFGVLYGSDGLLKPTAWMLWVQRMSRRWSLTFYAWLRHAAPALVVEIPAHWPLPRKVELQVAICEAARELHLAPQPAPLA